MAQFKLGRNRPDVFVRRLHFADYAKPALPDPPQVAHWSTAAYQCLRDIYANDTLGDCTAAGAGHILGLLRANAHNNDPLPTTQAVIEFYSRTTGYVPGKPDTDQGGDEITVLNDWRSDGFFPDRSGKIAAWVALNGAEERQVKQAIWLFENCYFGVELPDAWISPFPDRNGFIWDAAGDANPNNGHCFVGVGYNDSGVIVDTWGLLGTVTWRAIAKYATTVSQGELYAVLSEDAINCAKQKSPSGFEFSRLIADSGAL
jgi:hypothetical protein